jgi:hypothetical protein
VAIAKLSNESRCELLDRAKRDDWSIQQLRAEAKDAVKAVKKESRQPAEGKPLRLQVLVNQETLVYLNEGAQKQKAGVAKFAGDLLDRCRKQEMAP